MAQITKNLEVNDNTRVQNKESDAFKHVHLRQFGACHWAHDKGVVNVELTQHKRAEWIEFDITEDNLETGHQKRVMFSLDKDELRALKLALSSLDV
jgi:hypothetical protein